MPRPFHSAAWTAATIAAQNGVGAFRAAFELLAKALPPLHDAGVTTDPPTASPGIVEINLTPYRLPEPPIWRRNYVAPFGFTLFIFVLLIASAVGGNQFGPILFFIGLGILALAVLAMVVYGLPFIFRQRSNSSVIGRKIDFLRPENVQSTPPHFDRSLGDILQQLSRLAQEGRRTPVGPPPTVVIPARTRMHARAYTVGAVAVMIAWVLLMFVGVGGALPTMAMLLAMGALLTRRRRVLAKGADIVLVDDGRAPVLFLRSFKDDTIKLKQRQELFGLMGLQKIRFEETLADMVGQYGPLLAVGEPSEGLPQLGAARAYLADDAWQSQVQRWIGESRMIAMLCGPTRWVHWEMQNIVAAQRLSALLLFLPPGRKAAGGVARRRLERWDNIVSSLAATPYGSAMRALDIADVLLIQFKAEGDLVVYRSKGDTVQDYDLAAALAAYSILIAAPAPTPGATLTPIEFAAPGVAPGARNPPSASSGDRLKMGLKFAGFGALAGLLGLIAPRLGHTGVSRMLGFIPIFALAVTAAGALFWTRRWAPLARLFGLLFAETVIQILLFSIVRSQAVSVVIDPGLPLLLLLVVNAAATVGILALGERRLRWLFSPPSLAILAVRVALEFIAVVARATPLAALLAVVDGAILAGLIGYGLSRSRAP